MTGARAHHGRRVAQFCDSTGQAKGQMGVGPLYEIEYTVGKSVGTEGRLVIA